VQSQRDTESKGAESEGLGIQTQRYTESEWYSVRGSRVRVSGAQSQRDTRSEAEPKIYRVRGVQSQRDAKSEGYRVKGIKSQTDKESEGYRVIGIQSQKDAESKGYIVRGIQSQRDT
jgi:hypothetical protein